MKAHGAVAWADAASAAYERLIGPLRETARAAGYAITTHGSLARDIDLLAVPWVIEAVSAEVLVGRLIETIERHNEGIAIVLHRDNPDDPHDRNPAVRSHGRLAWSIHLGGGPYIDLSVMPRGHISRVAVPQADGAGA